MKNEKTGHWVNFTKKNIESIPLPEKGCSMYHDTNIPGLVLRVYPSGIKSFAVYRKIKGQVENITIGRYGMIHPEQARKQAAELNSQIGSGKNPAEEKRSIRDEMTLGNLFLLFLENHAKKHKRTWRYDENMFRLYFAQWAGRRISTVTRREVQTLHARMGEGNGTHQANRAFAMLRSVFEKGREWGYAGENPCFKLKRFTETSRDRYLQPDELPRFFQAILAEPLEMERDFVFMLLYTGARKSNVLGMAWRDINLDLRVWNIPAAESKNATAYTVPLVSFALEILTRRKNENSGSIYVFPSISKSGHLQEPKRAWARMLKASGLNNVRMHDLRRSLGSYMAITGASLLTISYALGHKLASLSVTAVYARANVDPIRVAMETAVRAMCQYGGMVKEVDNVVVFQSRESN